MIKFTRRSNWLLCYGEDAQYDFDLDPWNIPSNATEIWFAVSLKPGGVPYAVYSTPYSVRCSVAGGLPLPLPLPLACEILKKVKTNTSTIIYLEVWYA